MEQEFEHEYKADVINAVKTMFSLCANPRERMSINDYINKFKQKVDNITMLNQDMKTVKAFDVSCMDLLEYIKKHYKKENVVLFIDPPYPFTKGKYKKNYTENVVDSENIDKENVVDNENDSPSTDLYEQITKLLENPKRKCKFVLFFRVEDSWAGGDTGDNRGLDYFIVTFIKKLFKCQNYYYQEWNCHGTTEGILTDFQFEGSEHY